MNVEELFASFEALIEANRPARDDVVYLARRGDDYDWCIVGTDGASGAVGDPVPPRGQSGPDAWMSFSADWPKNRKELRAFFGDLLAELESMISRADRCRWPVGEPWPHVH
ncbi:hypothetical protein A9W99_13385 [Mycobacterium sp. 1164966.3]|uniref:hypothetical protein n=1 Tax=Mycobacterium sp. 1164966.3 TaxID=1856861 RepID=UPI0007FF3FEA|nr:hypothetical protein [Mycobacterium sp. 1164966.3]OBA81708.1 hypothetical protein A9W99_13385 [Mycobacterium sp. 1164966.3]